MWKRSFAVPAGAPSRVKAGDVLLQGGTPDQENFALKACALALLALKVRLASGSRSNGDIRMTTSIHCERLYRGVHCDLSQPPIRSKRGL
jgi:hypothetical protein